MINREEIFNKAKIEDDFVIKTIRTDEFCFIFNFMKMIVQPTESFSLRRGSKKNFTVTGSGIFARHEAAASPQAPLKKPQYNEEKNGFATFQSASYGFPDFYPKMFGHLKRENKLIGFIFPASKSLLSDRLRTYDGGTVGRKGDFQYFDEAQQYFNDRKGKVLFSLNEIEKFKQAIKNNPEGFNEVLARLKWLPNEPGFYVAIGSDNFETRMWAQAYAAILQWEFLKHGKGQINIPICFYLPGKDKHLAIYAKEQQQHDKLEAQQIISNDILQISKNQEKNWEYLFGITIAEEIFCSLVRKGINHSLLFEILSQGYGHIIQFLLKDFDDTRIEALISTAIKAVDRTVILNSLKTICRHDMGNILRIFLNIIQDDLNKFTDKELCQVVDIATEYNRPNALGLLLEHTVFKKLITTLVEPLFIKAVEYDLVNIVKVLLAHGINVNTKKGQYNNIETVLHLAVKNGQKLMVSILVGWGADLNIPDLSGNTPVHHAVMLRRDDILQLLLEGKRPNLTQLNQAGLAPIHIAADNENAVAVKMLIKLGKCDYTVKNNHGKSAIDIIFSINNYDLMKVLIEETNIDVNKKVSSNGARLLHLTINSYSNKILSNFLKLAAKKGLDIDAQDDNGNTALHNAVSEDEEEQIETLLQAGARFDIVNNNKLNAIDIFVQADNGGLNNYDDYKHFFSCILMVSNKSMAFSKLTSYLEIFKKRFAKEYTVFFEKNNFSRFIGLIDYYLHELENDKANNKMGPSGFFKKMEISKKKQFLGDLKKNVKEQGEGLKNPFKDKSIDFILDLHAMLNQPEQKKGTLLDFSQYVPVKD